MPMCVKNTEKMQKKIIKVTVEMGYRDRNKILFYVFLYCFDF